MARGISCLVLVIGLCPGSLVLSLLLGARVVCATESWMDLDGAGEAGCIGAEGNGSVLRLRGAVWDSYSGQWFVRNGGTFATDSDLLLAGTGTCRLGATVRAEPGATLSLNGYINCTSGGQTLFSGEVRQYAGHCYVDALSTLRLQGRYTMASLTYAGTYVGFHGPGKVSNEAEFHVYGDRGIEVALLDLDGPTETAGPLWVHNNSSLTVGSTLSDPMDGIIYLDGGSLTMAQPWTMRGPMEIRRTSGIHGGALRLMNHMLAAVSDRRAAQG